MAETPPFQIGATLSLFDSIIKKRDLCLGRDAGFRSCLPYGFLLYGYAFACLRRQPDELGRAKPQRRGQRVVLRLLGDHRALEA